MKSELDRAYNENIGRRIREEMKKKHMTWCHDGATVRKKPIVMGFFDVWRRNRDLFINILRYTKPHIYTVFFTSPDTKKHGFLIFWCQNGATEDARCLHGLFLHEGTKKTAGLLRRCSSKLLDFLNRRFAGFIKLAPVIDRHERLA